MKRRVGIVYLIHFEQPIGNLQNPLGKAQHYIGWSIDLPERMKDHAKGSGAAIMAYLKKVGIPWRVVRTWRGNRHLERKFKRQGHAPNMCPCCNAKLPARIKNRAITIR